MKKALILKFIELLILAQILVPIFNKTSVVSGGYPANSMWIGPSVVNATGMSVGDRFNVTVWLNVSVNCGAWQFYLIYNKQQLNVTKYGLTGTGGSISQFFEKCGSRTWGMVSSEGDHNATHKYIMIGESWKSGPFGTGAGSLAWIEFEIKTQPPEGGELTSILDIASGHHPPTSDTCALDPNMKEIPLSVYNCMFIFKSPTAPPPPPPPAVAKLYVDPPEIIDPTLMPCSEFNINITITNVSDLKKVSFNLTYNPNVIGLIRVSVITIQGQTPSLKSIIDDENGFIWVGLTYPSSINIDEPQAILKVDFHVESFGLTVLDLQNSALYNSSGQLIEHETADGFFCTLIRDVAITNVALSSNWAYRGWKINITVTIMNKGITTETFWLTIYYNNSILYNVTISEISPGEERTVIFEWDTTSLSEGNYTIKAEAEILPYELNTSDNEMVGGTVWIMTRIHDVAIIGLNLPQFAYQGWQVKIAALIENVGEFPEGFAADFLINDSVVWSTTVESLLPNEAIEVIFTWNTSNVAPCRYYNVSVKLSLLPFEFNSTNNLLFGVIKVRYMGDVDGDGKVDIKDILEAALSYGAVPLSPRWNPAADLDCNQKIDIRDMFLLAKNYGKGCI